MLPVAHWPSVSWADEVFPLLGQPGPWLPAAPQTFSAQVSLLSVLWNGSSAMAGVTPALHFASAWVGSAVKIQGPSFGANYWKAAAELMCLWINCWHYSWDTGPACFPVGAQGWGSMSGSVRNFLWWDCDWHHAETSIALKTCKAAEGFLEQSKRQGMGYFSFG